VQAPACAFLGIQASFPYSYQEDLQAIYSIASMCHTNRYVSTTCSHCWLQIYQPCVSFRGLIQNFSTCPEWCNGSTNAADRLPPYTHTYRQGYECPKCDYQSYDTDHIRIVLRERQGSRTGTGPGRPSRGRTSPGIGVDCSCTVM